VEEYVVTPQIRKDIDNIIDGFLESRQRRPSDVCSWISGFFWIREKSFFKDNRIRPREQRDRTIEYRRSRGGRVLLQETRP